MMKNVFILAMILSLLYGCSKENHTNTNNSDVEPLYNTEEGLLLFSSKIINTTYGDHESIARILSKMIQKKSVRDYFVLEINTNGFKSYSSISFLDLLTKGNADFFAQEYSYAVLMLNLPNYNFEYFINSYLVNHPNLSLSLYSPEQGSDLNSNIDNVNEIPPVFSEMMYDGLNQDHIYPLYKNGTFLKNSTNSEGPNIKVFVLQEREGFTSLLENYINDEDYFNKWSKVLYCSDLVATIKNSLNFNKIINSPTIQISSNTYTNPFFDRYFVKDRDITENYNRICPPTWNPPVSPPSPPVPPLFDCGNGEPSQRTTWNNEVLDERSYQIRIPAGNDLLELNHDWCAWWNKNCRFKIDLFVPSAYNAETFVPVQPGPYFAWYNEKLLKNKKLRVPISPLKFIPWQYEAGKHGDEWKYLWTGKHRKEGDVSTFTLSAQLSPKVTFKVDGLGLELTQKLGASYSIQRTNKDLELGGDFVYWCDDILVGNNLRGPNYSTGDVDFKIRESKD